MEPSFGKFIETKRTEKGISLRGMAQLLDIAPSYLSDIEKGRRNPPDKKMLDEIAKLLALIEKDKLMMFDLAGKDRESIPPDLPEYIIENEMAVTFLRKAQKNQISKEQWRELIKRIDKE